MVPSYSSASFYIVLLHEQWSLGLTPEDFAGSNVRCSWWSVVVPGVWVVPQCGLSACFYLVLCSACVCERGGARLFSSGLGCRRRFLFFTYFLAFLWMGAPGDVRGRPRAAPPGKVGSLVVCRSVLLIEDILLRCCG